MKQIQHKGFYILLIASLIVFTANIWGVSIYILDEAKNATCAREMYERADWIVPTFNFELRTDKPPLHYYFMQVGYFLFGINEFGARFFSALMGFFTVLITYFFTHKALDRLTAFFAGLAMLSSIQFATQFHLATPDPYLIFFITLSLFSFHYAHQTKEKTYLYLFYVAIALAVLSKGPVAIALPGLILLIYLISQKDFTLKTIQWALNIPAILLFLLLVLPWYILVHIKTQGAYTEGFFLKHNVSRFTSTMEGHGGGIYMIPLFIITGLFPFSLFIFQAFYSGWKKRKNALIQLSMITVLVFVVFFSISRTKLPSYPAPCFPFAAILIGYYMKELVVHLHVTKYKINLIVYSILAFLFPLGIYFGVTFDSSLKDLQHVAFFFMLLPIGGIAIWFYHKQPLPVFFTIGGSFYMTSLLFFYFVFPKVDLQNPVNEGISKLENIEKVVAYQRFNPAFAFYYRKPIEKLPHLKSVEEYLSENRNTLIITNTRSKASLDSLKRFEILYDKKDLFEPRNTKIFKSKRSLSYNK